MSTYRFDRLLSPRSVALVGASARPNAFGAAILRNLREAGFGGPIWPVNPRHDSVDGVQAFADLADLPEPADLVVIVTPPETVPEVVAAAGRKGCGAAVVITTGLGSGPDSLAEAARAAARRHSLRLVGPDSMGLAVPRAALNASLLARAPLAGDLALISQSRTVAAGIVAWAQARGTGFSGIVSLGNALDVDIADCLDHFAADIHTRAILLSIGTVTDAPKFMSAARAAARAKPVVVLRSGRHDVAAQAIDGRQATHTGLLARTDAVYDAAFRRAGLLRVQDLDEMFSAVETLGRQRPFPGRRLAILANGRGVGAIAVDRLMDLGGSLAGLSDATRERLAAAFPGAAPGAWRNPVDIGADADGPRYAAALEALIADRDNDAVLVINVPTALSGGSAVATEIVEAVKNGRKGTFRARPVFAVTVGDEAAGEILSQAGIPRFATDADAVEGFTHLVRYREAQDDLTTTPAVLPDDLVPDAGAARSIVDRVLAEERTWLDPREMADLLAAYGIPVQPVTLVPDADAAAEVAWPIIAAGGTVALKLASPDVVHKSDVGGVRLGLTSEAAVREAAAEMRARVAQERPGARITGFVVQAMLRRTQARELIAGLADDPVFGPVVVFGRGGTAVEVIDDRALALPPLDRRLAADLIGRTRVARRLKAYRDVAAADEAAVALVLVKLGQLAADLPELRELDINPLLADRDGVIALDARACVAPLPPERRRDAGTGPSHARFAVRPYPRAWERRIALDDQAILVRPVRAEDEGLFEAFFKQVSAEDLRLRFFAPVRDFSHAFLARLTQLDYARAIAFVAIEEATGTMMGAVRLHADANHETGEYAILVRSDLKGLGLGWSLMGLMLDWAKAEGLRHVEGQVLRENTTMLAMCRKLGFTVRTDPSDPDLMLVRRALTEESAAPSP
ncbi:MULTISPECIES: bifunctional acetate--CoA ligase family protein/GNAT family N-acetyltransferase [Methylobacterium]|uniref:bifunctional acetate--CoA ligase family protein/GNAT family N-acetyltransferase n=1 Tax=Methylobacterium TaxID=407 RepID=UPI0013ED9F6F|nr:bifunctional acetate--CoA ligase family protein/GNAT family N-acetyltransferase [Methylobacterium sp. DB0501]NGM33372.1 bifunctional acetate--CoA ligase family protein/GNAT family N-acetyltransferase [Methylobacterium sp. DB0501]